MSHLLVLRPRYGHADHTAVRAWRRTRTDPRTFDDAVIHEASRRRYPATKTLSENFAPFLRYLGTRVGDRWNDVYADIRSVLRVDSATQLHVVQHIKDFVTTSTWRDADGSLRGHARFGGPTYVLDTPRWRQRGFYVDTDGLLQRLPQPGRKAPPSPRDDARRVGDVCFVVRHGAWFTVVLAPLGHFRWQHSLLGDAVDVILGPIAKVSHDEARRFYGRSDVYAIRIGQQLGKRALKRFELTTPAVAH